MIREMTAADWPAVKRIYEDGIATGFATFETEAPSYEEWDATHLAVCRFVYVNDRGEVLGWIVLSPVSDRCVYGGVAEETVYVSENARGQGVASALFEALIPASEAEGFWTLQAGMFPENEASIKVHEKAGFRAIGRREKIGQMNGVWRDTLLLERRSPKF